MRNNQPVTDKEYVLRDGAAIISRTDGKGLIVDCNEEFIEASGFTRDELIGKPHNMVRHPDMPPAAFHDFWDTLKRGRPWSGMVKNRRKNGDFYWVRATATPLPDGSGYSSVRTKPSPDEINQAKALYARLRNGENIQLYEGRVVSGGWLAALKLKFESLTFSTRLWGLAAFMCVLLGIASLIGIYIAHTFSSTATRIQESDQLVADILPPPLYLVEANMAAHRLLNTADKATLLTRIDRLKEEYDARVKYWEKSSLAPAIKTSLLGTQRQYADQWWKEIYGSYLPAVQRQDNESARLILDSADAIFDKHRAGVDATVQLSSGLSAQALQDLGSHRSGSTRLLLGFFIGGLILSLLFVALLNRKLRDRVSLVSNVTMAIASGDLTRPIPPLGSDEMGSLVAQMAIMRNSLHELIAAVRQNVESLSKSATRLSTTASGSAEASEAQSEAASSMAAAVEQLSVSIDMVEQNAIQAKNVTQESAMRSTEGASIILDAAKEMELIAGAVHTTAETIRELEEVSQQISSIAGVIKDIADQTNLLALNAAIEAARAGEQGRGFAVVADEVRKLAERTGNSTQEISHMIVRIQNGSHKAAEEMDAGVNRVNEGVILARKAGETINQIRSGSDQVTHSVEEITLALKEQVTASRDIAQKVEHIAQGAEANSATSSTTLVSARQLEELSVNLEKLTTKFRIS